MPAAVWKKRRRDNPCRRASRSLMAISRASTSRCRADCGTGRYSSLDTICVGTGEGNDEVSAGNRPLIISSLRNFMVSSRVEAAAAFYRHRCGSANAWNSAVRPSTSLRMRSVLNAIRHCSSP